MAFNPETFFNDKSVKPVSFENTEKILFQMKNCICKIYKNNGTGSGFFCKIPYPDQSNLLNVLITNNHVLNENDLKNNNIIKYSLKDNIIRKIKIDNNKRKIYTSKELDITFIEIKQNEDNINEFLDIDEELINQNKEFIETTIETNNKYKSIYIIHYPQGGDIVVSYGIIDKIKNEQINHYCYTLKGSSGSPILSLETFKVIGVHCGSIEDEDEDENCNKGIFIKYPINLFNKKTFTLSYKLYFEYKSDFKIFGEKFVENNKDKCIMIINDKKYELKTYINKEIIKNKSFEIKLKEIEAITDMSYMFYECSNLSDISNWNTFNVNNMSYMFYRCIDIPDISQLDTSNVNNMSYMFYRCRGIPDISQWDTSNVNNMSYMFYECIQLPDISNWNTSNVIDMSYMFYKCNNLPNISQWDTSKVINMSNMFCECNNLPNISQWDTSNVIDMSYMFYNCNNLPNISNWNTSKVTNMSYMFYLCKDLPDILNWNTSNVIDMSYMFYECSQLPDISNWNTSNVNNMNCMFYNCQNIPDISNWNTSNVNNMNCMFYNCKDLPNISNWNTSKICNFNLSILKSSPINIKFYLYNGKIINIVEDEFMTFSNLSKKLWEKLNIPNDFKNFKFYNNMMSIDPNSIKNLKDLNIINNSIIKIVLFKND